MAVVLYTPKPFTQDDLKSGAVITLLMIGIRVSPATGTGLNLVKFIEMFLISVDFKDGRDIFLFINSLMTQVLLTHFRRCPGLSPFSSLTATRALFPQSVTASYLTYYKYIRSNLYSWC